MAIVTLAEVKTFLGISGAAEDSKLNLIIGYVDATIKQYCGQNFEQATYTEFYSGTGNKTVVLRKRPVQSITNVWFDTNGNYGQSAGAFGSTTLLTSGVDYSLELDDTLPNLQVVSKAGILVRIATIWPEMNSHFFPGRLTQEYGPAFGNIKVTYVGGYPAAAFPADLKDAAVTMVSAKRRGAAFGGLALTSERISDYGYSLANPQAATGFSEIGSVRQILNRYKEIAIGEPR
jgi:hypothetical protein